MLALQTALSERAVGLAVVLAVVLAVWLVLLACLHVGLAVCMAVGLHDGLAVGLGVGLPVGLAVGLAVGQAVGQNHVVHVCTQKGFLSLQAANGRECPFFVRKIRFVDMVNIHGPLFAGANGG